METPPPAGSTNFCSCCANPIFLYVWSVVGFLAATTFVIFSSTVAFYEDSMYFPIFVVSIIVMLINGGLFFTFVCWKDANYKVLYWIVVCSICLLSLCGVISMCLGLFVPAQHGAFHVVANVYGFFIILLPCFSALLLCQILLALAVKARMITKKEMLARRRRSDLYIVNYQDFGGLKY